MELAAWSRKRWIGNLGVTDAGGPVLVRLVGVTEHAIPATNLDCIVDLTQSTYPTGVSVGLWIATYLISHVGQKVYQGQWKIELPSYGGGPPPPPVGVITVLFPVIATLGGKSIQHGYTTILQNGGVAGMVWGIEAGVNASGLTPGQTAMLQKISISSIAHGREV